MANQSLARRIPALGWVAVLASLLALGGCTSEKLTDLGAEAGPETAVDDPDFGRRCRRCDRVRAFEITPATASASPSATVKFAVKARTRHRAISVPVIWTATGGSIDSTGLFTAGSTEGEFRVVARLRSGSRVDTSRVRVSKKKPSPVSSLVLTPDKVSLAAGKTQKFAASGKQSDGTSVPVSVTWAATGGTVDTTGGYTAGTAPGSYRVIAKLVGGTLADTSAVTIANGTPDPAPNPPPTDPPPTPNPPPGPVTGDYYVAPSGSDGNSGTSAAPFRTIGKAASVVKPGQTVVLRDGTYPEAVNLSRSGTASGWITFAAENRGRAVQTGNTNQTAWNISGSYIVIQGIQIRGFQQGLIVWNDNPGAYHDITFKWNEIHQIGSLCTSTNNSMAGAAVSATRVTFDGNLFHDIGRLPPGGGCNPSNSYWMNHDHAIYIEAGADHRIINNVFWNVQRGWPIQRYDSDGDAAPNLLIAHNTFIGANPNRDGQVIIATRTQNVRIVNNVSSSSKGFLLWEGSGFSGRVERNLSSGALNSGSAGSVTSSGNLSGDPRLDASYRLQSGSPAIDVGMVISEVKLDASGKARTGAPDLGAYER